MQSVHGCDDEAIITLDTRVKRHGKVKQNSTNATQINVEIK